MIIGGIIVNELVNLSIGTANLACKNNRDITRLEQKLSRTKVGTGLLIVSLAWTLVVQATEIQKLKDEFEKHWKE